MWGFDALWESHPPPIFLFEIFHKQYTILPNIRQKRDGKFTDSPCVRLRANPLFQRPRPIITIMPFLRVKFSCRFKVISARFILPRLSKELPFVERILSLVFKKMRFSRSSFPIIASGGDEIGHRSRALCTRQFHHELYRDWRHRAISGPKPVGTDAFCGGFRRALRGGDAVSGVLPA